MRWIAPRGGVALLMAGVLFITSCTSSSDESDPTTPAVPTIPTSTNPQSSTLPATTGQSAAPAPQTSTEAQPDPQDDCSDWDTKKDEGGKAGTEAEIYNVRSGLHDCYQRVVFDINGAVVDASGAVNLWFRVEYVDTVYTEAKGDPLESISGSKTYLQAVIFAPAQGFDSNGHQPGQSLASVGSYVLGPDACGGEQPVCGVRFGGTHEGQSTFAVGVSAKLHFRVWSTVDGNVTKVVVDVAYS